MKKWEVTDSEYIVNDRWLRLRADKCRNCHGNIIEPYYVMELTDWVSVVALTDDNKVVMVRQYRHGYGDFCLELPAGRIEKEDLSPEETARRELLEETGYSVENMTELSKMPFNTSNCTNSAYCYIGFGAEKVQEPEDDPYEETETVLADFDEVLSMIINGKLQSIHSANFLLAREFLDGKIF